MSISVCLILYLILMKKVVFNHHTMENQLKKSIAFRTMILDYFQLVFCPHMKAFSWKDTRWWMDWWTMRAKYWSHLARRRASRITKKQLKAGIHRVIYPQQSKRRLTIWYEICTTEQLKNISEKKANEIMPGGMVTLPMSSWCISGACTAKWAKIRFSETIWMVAWMTMTKAPPPRYILPKHDISFPTNDANMNDTGAESSVKQSRLHPRTESLSDSQPLKSKISKRTRRGSLWRFFTSNKLTQAPIDLINSFIYSHKFRL